MSLQHLTAAVERYTTMLKAYIDNRGAGSTSLISEKVSIAAGASRTYNLATLLPNGITGIDVLATQVRVKIQDTDAQSTTVNHYINAEAAITIGITEAGMIRVVNYSLQALNCHVQIDLPPPVNT